MTALNKKYINVPNIPVPHTTIQNRAMIPDLSKDLGVRMGVERIQTQNIYKISDEQGPNGETVYGVEGDDIGLFRVIGKTEAHNDTWGQHLYLTPSDAFEITFYGTGLNILLGMDNNTETIACYLDGTLHKASVHPVGPVTPIIGGRNTDLNNIVDAISNVTLGTHTARFEISGGIDLALFGFEVLNESSQLTINQGESQFNDSVINTLTQSNLPYNSGFESGVLGTRGGRVAVYQKIDGTIAHAVTPVNATAKYLALTDHTNEEIARNYNFREFGAGRSDDFSTLDTVNTNRAFTLNDNTTTLVGNAVVENGSGVNIQLNNSSFITLTFVGTGLDLDLHDTVAGSNSNANAIEYFVDGVSVGFHEQTGVFVRRIKPICSGLPYGTHTVKVMRNTISLFNSNITDFIVYQPKTPSIPVNSQLLGTYNVLADYVADTVSGNIDSMSTGVILKDTLREFIYVGTWAITLPVPTTVKTASFINTSTTGDYAEYTFFGTGFDIECAALTGTTVTLMVDGTPYTGPATVVGTATSWVSGTSTFTPSTTNGARLSVSGLALGKHTLRLTKAGGTTFYLHALQIITPIYNPVQAVRNKQNTLAIGSNSIGDERKFTELENVVKKVNYVYAGPISATPSTSSTVDVPLSDMSCTITTGNSLIDIDFQSTFYSNSTYVIIYAYIYVDGKQTGVYAVVRSSVNSEFMNANLTGTVQVGKGTHLIQIFWKVSAGIGYSEHLSRSLSVLEL